MSSTQVEGGGTEREGKSRNKIKTKTHVATLRRPGRHRDLTDFFLLSPDGHKPYLLSDGILRSQRPMAVREQFVTFLCPEKGSSGGSPHPATSAQVVLDRHREVTLNGWKERRLES